MNDILLNEHFGYDEAIMDSLMYEGFDGEIKDSGKSGDERIYLTLGWMEKEYNVNL
jgi:hypothetical protein|tara:strand:+ start:2025 stop:2192 length:168 start_codon:yes stop_codon:yes gene_type:complete